MRSRRVNDTHGHAAGDAVLKDVAYILRRELRAYDLAYRVGGEGFLVLLPGATLREAAIAADSLREAVAARPLAGHRVTMSFGVAASEPGTAFDAMRVTGDADAALYQAKAAGRNCVRVAQPAASQIAA